MILQSPEFVSKFPKFLQLASLKHLHLESVSELRALVDVHAHQQRNALQKRLVPLTFLRGGVLNDARKRLAVQLPENLNFNIVLLFNNYLKCTKFDEMASNIKFGKFQ